MLRLTAAMQSPPVSHHDPAGRTPILSQERAAAAFAALEQYTPIALAVHAPFSRRACWFCGCGLPDLVFIKGGRTAYFSAVEAEIRLVAGLLGGRGRPSKVTFGAGSPIQPSPNEIARLLDVIEEELGLTDDAALMIELDPECLADPDIRTLSNLGFRRMSLCVLESNHPDGMIGADRWEKLERAVGAMRASEINDVGITIARSIAPEKDDEAGALAIVASLAPDRISVVRALGARDAYAPLSQHSAPAPLSHREEEGLVALGYVRIAAGCFVRPEIGFLTEDPGAGAALGFGIGAITSLMGASYENERAVGDHMRAVGRNRLPMASG